MKATSASGAAFCTAWAMEPSSVGTSSKLEPTRCTALAIDTTGFPARRAACSPAADTVARAVVASTTISAFSATSALGPDSM